MGSIKLEREQDVVSTLREKFPSQKGWVLLEQVANGTGANASRHLDVVAMQMWPSRGLELWGMEIKTRRSDWLNELKKPAKADSIGKYMDRFWVVAGSRQVVHEEELPKSWGLIQPRGEKLVKSVQAKLQDDPADLNRSFVAALVRRLETETEQQKVQEAYEKGRAEGYDDGFKKGRDSDATLRRVKRAHSRLKEKVDTFEEELGQSLSNFRLKDDQDIAAALRLVLEGRSSVHSAARQILRMRRNALSIANKLESELQDNQLSDDIRKLIAENAPELIDGTSGEVDGGDA
ncbi:MAG: hypothetical protein U5L04_02445 [Trueperaceae bacterium]|nr:hypothetical protein [Trueperaceae bacterium]